MEIFLEFLFELYLGIAEIFVPEGRFKKWQEKLLKLACILVNLGAITLIIVGIALIGEGSKQLGIGLLSGGATIVLSHTLLVAIAIIRERKNRKKDKER